MNTKRSANFSRTEWGMIDMQVFQYLKLNSLACQRFAVINLQVVGGNEQKINVLQNLCSIWWVICGWDLLP